DSPIYYLSRNLNDIESKYSYVEKLALAAVQVIQRFRHYVLFRKTTILSDCNPMTYILSRQLLGGKYSKWIAILQEFDLEFVKSKSKKALVFAELLCDLPSSSNDETSEESIVDENLFLISVSDEWYGDIIV
ncbi:RNase H-like domain-containing protein, partial [Actinobacillus pleuropneumoniae]|uniref:RNase H-like domain-containing protein n=1 Tax=Actinobacillus pleuropneumoniae TaxID=715 RepID=UPI00227C47F8